MKKAAAKPKTGAPRVLPHHLCGRCKEPLVQGQLTIGCENPKCPDHGLPVVIGACSCKICRGMK